MQQPTASARENAYLAKESGNRPKSPLLNQLLRGETSGRFLFFNDTSVPSLGIAPEPGASERPPTLAASQDSPLPSSIPSAVQPTDLVLL